MKYLITGKFIVLTLIMMGCASTGNKQKSKNSDGSSAQPTSYDNLDIENSVDLKDGGKISENSSKKEFSKDNSGPSKSELYDGLRISLGSSDDAVVEKSVANLLSQDMNDSRGLNSLGLYHLSKGREHLAKMIFKSMIDKDPKNPVAYNNLGVIYSQLGENKLAIDSFKKAISLNPQYAIVNANLGTIYAVGRDYGKARRLLEVAYKGGIKDIIVLNNYAVSMMEQGDLESDSIFKEALQIGASDPNVAFNYTLFLTYTKKNYKEASEWIDKIRFMGIPPNKKEAIIRMEETISGRNIEKN